MGLRWTQFAPSDDSVAVRTTRRPPSWRASVATSVCATRVCASGTSGAAQSCVFSRGETMLSTLTDRALKHLSFMFQLHSSVPVCNATYVTFVHGRECFPLAESASLDHDAAFQRACSCIVREFKFVLGTAVNAAVHPDECML